MMSFGTKRGEYYYSDSYENSAGRALGIVPRVIGTGVLLMFGWVAVTLSGHNPVGKMKYTAAVEQAAQSVEASVDANLIEGQVFDQYQQFSETLIVLHACEQNYFERSKTNRNDKVHVMFRTALRDYQNKNLPAYQEITQQLTMRAAGNMLRGNGAAVQSLHQDIGMLHRPRGGDPAKLAAYDAIAARGKDQRTCNGLLGKVKSGQLDIKIKG